jgi:hypothetical protein
MQKTKSKLSVVVSCKHHLIRMRVQTSQKTNVRIRAHPIDENKIMQNIAAAGDSRSSSGVSWTQSRPPRAVRHWAAAKGDGDGSFARL